LAECRAAFETGGLIDAQGVTPPNHVNGTVVARKIGRACSAVLQPRGDFETIYIRQSEK